jgi:excinuclease UvrABC nuclease subunit
VADPKEIDMADHTYSGTITAAPGFYVYRLWRADGVCLYVGAVGERTPRRVTSRLANHRQKPWWPKVARIDVAVLASPGEVIAEEPAQIAALSPLYNQQLRGQCAAGHILLTTADRDADWRCKRCHVERGKTPGRKAADKKRHLTRVRDRRVRRVPSASQQPLW